jgi:DNA modification methylase
LLIAACGDYTGSWFRAGLFFKYREKYGIMPQTRGNLMSEVQARLLPLSEIEQADKGCLQSSVECRLVPKSYTGLYSMHKYWAKKPYNVVRWFIDNYSKPGEIVMDPFSGSGITAIESVISGRKTIALDLNPVATFIATMSLTPIDLDHFCSEFASIKQEIKTGIDDLYRTECPACKQDAVATHTIWRQGTPETIWYRCGHCKTLKGVKTCSEDDRRFFDQIAGKEVPFWYPTDSLFENWRINVGKGQRVYDLFSKRNLYALAMLFQRIEQVNEPTLRNMFRFVFTAALSQASKMVFVIKNRGKMNGESIHRSEEVGSWVIGFWVPPEHFEINVWECFENRYKKTLRGKVESNRVIGERFKQARCFSDLLEGKAVLIDTADATDLSMLPDSSVDYVFTDPPHGDRVPYFELSLLWASWLKLDMDFKDEIVISNAPERGKTLDSYRVGLYKSFAEIARVLKPGKFVSVAFNNLDDRTWLAFLDACFSAGFKIESVYPLMYSANSVVQDSRQKGLKSDFIITCLNTCKPLKSFSYNTWIEDKDFLRRIVLDVGKKLCLGQDGASTTEMLNTVIPQLLKENRVFKISDIIGLIQENFIARNLRWFNHR